MIIVTLVFESFEENINMIFWGSLLLTNEEKCSLIGELGRQITPVLED